MRENTNGILVSRNSDEESREWRERDYVRWHLNYTEIDPVFDFQLNYVKYRRTWNAPGLHIHENSAEITWVLHGMQPYTVEGKDYCIFGGQGLISPFGLIHGMQRDAEQKGDFFYLTINPDCLAAVLPPEPGTQEALYALLNDAVTVRVFPNISQLSAAALELQRAYSDTRPYRKGRIICALYRLLLMTLDAADINNELAPYSDFMEQVYVYIEDHISEKLKVEDVAAAAQYSVTGLQRRFRTYSNLSVHEYIMSRKIEAAKKLMTETGTNPYRVWKELAFSSQSYFSQVFRKYVGMTITQYMENCHNDAEKQ